MLNVYSKNDKNIVNYGLLAVIKDSKILWDTKIQLLQ